MGRVVHRQFRPKIYQPFRYARFVFTLTLAPWSSCHAPFFHYTIVLRNAVVKAFPVQNPLH